MLVHFRVISLEFDIINRLTQHHSFTQYRQQLKFSHFGNTTRSVVKANVVEPYIETNFFVSKPCNFRSIKFGYELRGGGETTATADLSDHGAEVIRKWDALSITFKSHLAYHNIIVLSQSFISNYVYTPDLQRLDNSLIHATSLSRFVNFFCSIEIITSREISRSRLINRQLHNKERQTHLKQNGFCYLQIAITGRSSQNSPKTSHFPPDFEELWMKNFFLKIPLFPKQRKVEFSKM